jgi:hypothetical protein
MDRAAKVVDQMTATEALKDNMTIGHRVFPEAVADMWSGHQTRRWDTIGASL